MTDRIKIDKDFYTTNELAKKLCVSKVSVLKRIWRGNIKARKFGRNFIIFKKDIDFKRLISDIKK